MRRPDFETQDPIARGSQPRVVRGDDRSEAVDGVHLSQQGMQRVGGLLVEITRRFIGEQDRRFHDERPRDGHPLLLSAGQHARDDGSGAR